MGNKSNLGVRIWILLGLAALILLFAVFYYRYIPLLLPFQLALVPLILMILAVTSLNVRAGILLFVFLFPLTNSLPYFFGISPDIPHAPTALVLFLALFLGWITRMVFVVPSFEFHGRMVFPVKYLALAVLISSVITFLRYANFVPFTGSRFFDLVVNANGVRAGGALMSTVFSGLNYLTAFIFFLMLLSVLESREYLRRILLVVASSVFVAVLFALVQRYYSISLGNTAFFIEMGRLNSTFKDPNSFGLVLAAFVPVLLGMCFAFKRPARYFLVILLLFSLFVFPLIGSRSGILGLVVGCTVFVLMSLSAAGKAPRRKMLTAGLVVLVVICGVAALIVLSRGSSLYDRIAQDYEVLFKQTSLNVFLDPGRVGFWKMSLMILSEFPISGLGVGSFIVNVPNYGLLVGYTYFHTDSAENYFLQLGTEVGLIGLIFMLWLFYEIWRAGRTGFKRLTPQDPDRYLFIGLVSGLAAVFINLIFHSYIGAFDAKYFIWLLIGLTAGFHIHRNGGSERPVMPGRAIRGLAWAALGVLLLLHLWNSTHKLSIPAVTERFVLEQNFGLYGEEQDEQGRVFNWTSGVAGITVSNLRQDLLIPVRAAHPGIERHPVKLEIYRTNTRFRNIELVGDVTLESSEWTDVSLPLDEFPEDRVHFKLVPDRVWQPSKALGVQDTRLLGVALGKAWFASPAHIGEGYRTELTLGMEQWQGETGNEMFAPGVCSLVFQVDGKSAAIRLNVRGFQAGDEEPLILVRLDGRLIGRLRLEGEDWGPHVFFAGMEAGEHRLEVEYINDYIDLETGEDRNVYLGSVDVLAKEDGSPP